jgi:AcrR family transcriptional regulator
VPRPSRFDTDTFLDAAVQLAAESGPPAVTMAAVARRAGAPSGSVYHRFPDRASLTAALWLRTVVSFQAGLLDALRSDPAHDAAVLAATHVAEWSRAHPQHAAILLAGPDAFGQQDWPASARARLASANAALESALRQLARRLEWRTAEQAQRLVLIVVDLPYAVIRRHLSAGQPIDADTVEMITRAARDLTAPSGVPAARPRGRRQGSPPSAVPS